MEFLVIILYNGCRFTFSELGIGIDRTSCSLLRSGWCWSWLTDPIIVVSKDCMGVGDNLGGDSIDVGDDSIDVDGGCIGCIGCVDDDIIGVDDDIIGVCGDIIGGDSIGVGDDRISVFDDFNGSTSDCTGGGKLFEIRGPNVDNCMKLGEPNG